MYVSTFPGPGKARAKARQAVEAFSFFKIPDFRQGFCKSAFRPTIEGRTAFQHVLTWNITPLLGKFQRKSRARRNLVSKESPQKSSLAEFAGTNLPICGFTNIIGLISSFGHVFPMDDPSRGANPPITGLSKATGLTSSLGHV